MKESAEIHASLKERIEDKLKNEIRQGSMLDMFTYAIADEGQDMYQEIEDAKNPHLFTNTWGDDLDDLGYWVNLPRAENEDDTTYKYRLKDWVYSAEASNTISISNALLGLEYASNVDYIPYTHGCGTGSCYVIPKYYDEDTIASALEEAAERIEDIVSPSLYVEYIVPVIRAVKLECFLTVEDVSETMVRDTIEEEIKAYINAIAPGDFLKVGDLLKIGLNVTGTEYFNVLTVYVDEQASSELEIVQELETKFLYDEIVWHGEET